MSEKAHYAVVGASLAGLRCAEALRRRGHEGRITLLGDEAQRPYDRPPLSKQLLLGEWPPERTFFRQKDGYEPLGLELRLGVKATALDSAARALTLSDGETLHYDGLVIASGARPRPLPGSEGLAGVHCLRTLDDARAIVAALQDSPRVVVVGAGFIGLEVASACQQRGLQVTAVEALECPLEPILGRPMAERVLRLHRAKGVALKTGVMVQALEGDGRVERVRLADGSVLEADLVVVGIGVIPNTEWLQGSGVDVDNGVVCDSRCATSASQVVAAGDVASWYNPLFDERMRIEHWTNAAEMANSAVGRLLEGPQAAEFRSVPYFWSDQYDVKIQFAGRIAPGDELKVVEGDVQQDKFCALYGREGRLRGVLAFNMPAKLIKHRMAIGRGEAFP